MALYLALALFFVFTGLAIGVAVVLAEAVKAWNRYSDRKAGAAYLAAGRTPRGEQSGGVR